MSAKLQDEKMRIRENERKKEEKIMNKVKVLHELSMKKEQLKNCFTKFQAGGADQKKSMQMMEEYGIKSDRLCEMYEEMEREAKLKSKKNEKAEDEEEGEMKSG